MKEAVALGCQGHYLPDDPSPSGGYSTASAIPGHTWQPSWLCIQDYLRKFAVYIIVPGPPRAWIRVKAHARDPRPKPIPFDSITVAHYASGWGSPPRWAAKRAGADFSVDHFVDCPYQHLYAITVLNCDGTTNTHKRAWPSTSGSIETSSVPMPGWAHAADWR